MTESVAVGRGVADERGIAVAVVVAGVGAVAVAGAGAGTVAGAVAGCPGLEGDPSFVAFAA
jgi:hypothetical protein